MKKCKVLLLSLLMFMLSMSVAFANVDEEAIPDFEQKNPVIGYSLQFEYSPQYSKQMQNILRDLATDDMLPNIQKEIMSRKGINSKEILSEVLSLDERTFFVRKGVSPEEIKVYVIPITGIETTTVTSRGPDTVSYDKSVSYSVRSVLGDGKYRMRIKWNANKVTGACTLIKRKLTYLGGLNYKTWVSNSLNPRLSSSYDYFNGTVEVSAWVFFLANASGHISIM